MSFKKILAELIGTLLLVVFGCGTAMVTQCSFMNIGGYISTALAFGLVLMILISTVGKASGGHFNPIISVTMFLNRDISFLECICYVIAQFAGAFLGAYILRYLATSPEEMLYATNNLYDNDFTKTVVVEGIMSFVFIMSVLSNCKKENGALYIGGTLALVHLFGLGLTGTSVNPARTIGVAYMYGTDATNGILAFVIGPFIGALIAWMVYTSLIFNKDSKTESGVSKKEEKKEPEPTEDKDQPKHEKTKKKKKHLRLKIFGKKKKKSTKTSNTKKKSTTKETVRVEEPTLEDEELPFTVAEEPENNPDYQNNNDDSDDDGIDFDFDDNF